MRRDPIPLPFPPLWLRFRLFSLRASPLLPNQMFKRDLSTFSSMPLHFGNPLLSISGIVTSSVIGMIFLYPAVSTLMSSVATVGRAS